MSASASRYVTCRVVGVLLVSLCAFTATEPCANPADFEIVRTPEGISWIEARDSAVALGGYLAVVDYHVEQTCIAELLQDHDSLWMGGADVVLENRWRWVNGAPWGYESWQNGEADVADGADYLQIRADDFGHWFATNGMANGFVVEYPCCEGYPGDVDGDGKPLPDIADLIFLVSYMFHDGPHPPCLYRADITGYDGINIVDVVWLASYMFLDGPLPDVCAEYMIPITDTAVIVDQTGKVWDFSYGALFYGFQQEDFNFGAGVFLPITSPPFLEPGDPGYPAPTDSFPVLGGLIDGESRAYRLYDLLGTEVVDDQKDSIYFAATY